MSRLKEIKTKYNTSLSFEFIDVDSLRKTNGIEIDDKTTIGKVAVLFGHGIKDKEELLNSFKVEDFVWTDDKPETVYYGLENIQKALSDGSVLICDTINLDHIALCELVECFNSDEYNPNNAQLLFSTNVVDDQMFLDLRVDQIWFLDNNELYSLADFDDTHIVEPSYLYLRGRCTKPVDHVKLREELGFKKLSDE